MDKIEPDMEKSMAQLVEELVYEKMCLKKELKQLQIELLNQTTLSGRSLGAGGQFKGSMIVGGHHLAGGSSSSTAHLHRENSPTKKKTRGSVGTDHRLKANYAAGSSDLNSAGEFDSLERRHQTTVRELDFRTSELSQAKLKIETLELQLKFLQDQTSEMKQQMGGSSSSNSRSPARKGAKAKEVAVGASNLRKSSASWGMSMTSPVDIVVEPTAKLEEASPLPVRPVVSRLLTPVNDEGDDNDCTQEPSGSRILVSSPKRPQIVDEWDVFFMPQQVVGRDLAVEDIGATGGETVPAVSLAPPTLQLPDRSRIDAARKQALLALLSTQHAESVARLRELVFVNWRHEAKVSCQERRNAALSKEVTKAAAEVQDLTRAKTRLHDDLHELSGKVAEQDRALGGLAQEKDAISKEKDHIVQEKGKMEARFGEKVADLRTECERLRKRADEVRESLEREMEEAEKGWKKVEQSLQHQFSAAEAAARDAADRAEKAESHLSDAQKRATAAEEREKVVAEEMEELRKRYNELLKFVESNKDDNPYSEKKRITREQTLLKEIAALKKDLGREHSHSPTKLQF